MTIKIAQEASARMQKCVTALDGELTKLRTGRAHTSLLDHIKVDYYGNPTPLSQVASVAVENSRTLTITPWEKAMIAPIEKAILTSGLGLNPSSAGMLIRVPLPSLTEDRRRDLTRVVREEGEKARVAVRNIRRESNQTVKDSLKAKEISEDDERRAETEIQKVTDKFIAAIDELIAKKEKDLMSI